MAGSTTANRNRCIEMTKKTTVPGGAATKGGATSKRASAGGSARRPATATNKSTRVRGGSGFGNGEFASGIPAEIDKVIENKFKVFEVEYNQAIQIINKNFALLKTRVDNLEKNIPILDKIDNKVNDLIIRVEKLENIRVEEMPQKNKSVQQHKNVRGYLTRQNTEKILRERGNTKTEGR